MVRCSQRMDYVAVNQRDQMTIKSVRTHPTRRSNSTVMPQTMTINNEPLLEIKYAFYLTYYLSTKISRPTGKLDDMYGININYLLLTF